MRIFNDFPCVDVFNTQRAIVSRGKQFSSIFYYTTIPKKEENREAFRIPCTNEILNKINLVTSPLNILQACRMDLGSL